MGRKIVYKIFATNVPQLKTLKYILNWFNEDREDVSLFYTLSKFNEVFRRTRGIRDGWLGEGVRARAPPPQDLISH